MNKSSKYAALAALGMSILPTIARAQSDGLDYSSDVSSNAASSAVAGTLVGGFVLIGIIWFVFFVVAVLLFIFWIFMLIDVFKRTNWKDESDKTLWILLVILLNGLGAIIYYFAVKRVLDAPKKSNKSATKK